MSFLELQSRTLGPEQVAHAHDYHQLILATCGATELAIGSCADRVTGNRGCLIPSTSHHEYVGDGHNRTLVLDIPLSSLASVRDSSGIERLFDKPRFFSVPTGLTELAGSLMRQLEQCPALHSEIAALLLRALYLHLEAEPRGGVDGLSLTHQAGERLDMPRINVWVDHHLADDIRVEQLAALCALSTGHFHHCFRSLTGYTPQAYVQLRRLEHARSLVCHSVLSLGHIASLVGFRDQGSFSRAYRRQFEVSPSFDRRVD